LAKDVRSIPVPLDYTLDKQLENKTARSITFNRPTAQLLVGDGQRVDEGIRRVHGEQKTFFGKLVAQLWIQVLVETLHQVFLGVHVQKQVVSLEKKIKTTRLFRLLQQLLLTFHSYVLQDVDVAFLGHFLAEINIETHVGPHRVPSQTLLLSVANETHKIPPLFGVKY
jgi:hypothetical protein